MLFRTRRNLAEHQLNWRWADYVRLKNWDGKDDEGVHSKEDIRYYLWDKRKEYDIAKAVITGMGYWCSRGEDGRHKVVKRNYPRFDSSHEYLWLSEKEGGKEDDRRENADT